MPKNNQSTPQYWKNVPNHTMARTRLQIGKLTTQEHNSRALYLAHRRVTEFSERDCDTRIRAKYIREKDFGSVRLL